MTPEEIIAKVKQRAKDNFKTGLNCAECDGQRWRVPGNCQSGGRTYWAQSS